jgi:hypothetical protein
MQLLAMPIGVGTPRRITLMNALKYRQRRNEMPHRLVLSTIAALFLTVTTLKAEPMVKELQLLTEFETICISNANSPNMITQMLTTKGATETGQFSSEMFSPPPIGGAFKALLMPLQGKSFKLRDCDLTFAISITDTGACSLSTPAVNGDAVETLLKDHMFANQIGKEITGGVAHMTYAISYPTPVDTLHALIFIDRPLRINSYGVRLSSLGDLYLRARVPKEPEWPVLPTSSELKSP